MLKKYKCITCGNGQSQGSYCLDCLSTDLVSVGTGVPSAGCGVISCNTDLVSLGYTDERGRLSVALSESPSAFWGYVDDWILT